MSIHTLKPLRAADSPQVDFFGTPLDIYGGLYILDPSSIVGSTDPMECLRVQGDGKFLTTVIGLGEAIPFLWFWDDDGIIPPTAIINSIQFTAHHTSIAPGATVNGDVGDPLVQYGPGPVLVDNFFQVSSFLPDNNTPYGVPTYQEFDIDPTGQVFSNLTSFSAILPLNLQTGLPWLRSDLFPAVNQLGRGLWVTKPALVLHAGSYVIDYIGLIVDYVGIEINSVSPNTGGVFGGASVAVHGLGFTTSGTITNVYFGTTPATSIFVLNDTILTCLTPTHDIGAVTISIEVDGVIAATSSTALFTYESPFVLETTTPVRIGDTIKLNSSNTNLLAGTAFVQLKYTNPINGLIQIITLDIIKRAVIINNTITINNMYPIITKTKNILWFSIPFIRIPFRLIPFIFDPIGFDPITFARIPFPRQQLRFNARSIPATVTLIGNGIQFSGSVLAGTLEVLLEDASGIYVLDNDQTNDLLYFREGFTTAFSSFMLFESLSSGSNDSFETFESDSFFNLLSYPYKILAQNDEDIEFSGDSDNSPLEDFFIISTLEPVVVTNNVEIPSPFIKTAFLP